jgi:hypothetical protein
MNKENTLLDKLVYVNNFFQHFKKEEDIKMMYVMIYHMRAIHGKMLYILNKKINEISNKSKKLSKDYYNISIYQSLIDNSNSLITSNESTLEKMMVYNNANDIALKYNISDDNLTLRDLEKQFEELPIDLKTSLNNVYEDSDIDMATEYAMDDIFIPSDNTQIENSTAESSDQNLNTELVMSNDEIEDKKLLLPTLILFCDSEFINREENKKVWDDLKDNFMNISMNIISVDCSNNSEMCQKYEINNIPTIELFYGKIFKYNGEFSIDKILEFVNSNIQL